MPKCKKCGRIFQYKTICSKCEQEQFKQNDTPKEVRLVGVKRMMKETSYNKLLQEIYVFADDIIEIIEEGKKVVLKR